MVEESVARARQQVLESLRRRLADVDLRTKAADLGANYDTDRGELVVTMLGRELRIDRALRARAADGEIDYEEEVVLLNSLLSPGGSQGSSWVTFREMAAGHAADFRADVELPLAHAAERVVAAGDRVAAAVGARVVDPVGGSDLSLESSLFPGVRALVQVYLPDMEFPADARVLFSAGADRFVPPGCLEELGHRLAERILSAI